MSSTTVTVVLAVAVLPEPSVTVHVTVVSPSGNTAGASLVVLATLQLSAVVGDPKVTPVASQLSASVLTITAAGAVIVGSMSSTTVTVALAVAIELCCVGINEMVPALFKSLVIHSVPPGLPQPL